MPLTQIVQHFWAQTRLGDPRQAHLQGQGMLPGVRPLGHSYTDPLTSITITGAGYLRSESGSSFWNIEYYQKYFDVDTKTVRCSPVLVLLYV